MFLCVGHVDTVYGVACNPSDAQVFLSVSEVVTQTNTDTVPVKSWCQAFSSLLGVVG